MCHKYRRKYDGSESLRHTQKKTLTLLSKLKALFEYKFYSPLGYTV